MCPCCLFVVPLGNQEMAWGGEDLTNGEAKVMLGPVLDLWPR